MTNYDPPRYDILDETGNVLRTNVSLDDASAAVNEGLRTRYIPRSREIPVDGLECFGVQVVWY